MPDFTRDAVYLFVFERFSPAQTLAFHHVGDLWYFAVRHFRAPLVPMAKKTASVLIKEDP